MEGDKSVVFYVGGIIFLVIGIIASNVASLASVAVLPLFRAEQGLGPDERPYSGPVGSVTAEVPTEYAEIFKMAGEKFGVQPAFLAAIFYKEHGKGFPSISGPWASSPAGAQGPFQFIPSTWQSHKQDCDGDGIMDVQNIKDAACGAAHLLSAIGAGNNNNGDTPEKLAKLKDAASKYNSGCQWDPDPAAAPRCRAGGQAFSETADYVPDVITAFQKFYAQPELIGVIRRVLVGVLYYNKGRI